MRGNGVPVDVAHEYVLDGLDLKIEFDRLLQLRYFQYPLVLTPPELRIRHFKVQPRTLGRARDGRQIVVNVGRDPAGLVLDRYDWQEVLIHELTHIYVQQRYARHEVKSHGPEFYRHLDAVFEEAYGELYVVPGNKNHGRYAAALRQHALVEGVQATLQQIDDVLDEANAHEPIAPERLPEPLRSYMQEDEPPGPIGRWLNGMNEPTLERVGSPIRSGGRSVSRNRVEIRTRDAQVFDIISRNPGRTRGEIEFAYALRHGEYQGASVYNSMWRLRRDGRIERDGRRWFAVMG